MTLPARCDRGSVYCNKELPGTWSAGGYRSLVSGYGRTECQDYVSVYGPPFDRSYCRNTWKRAEDLTRWDNPNKGTFVL